MATAQQGRRSPARPAQSRRTRDKAPAKREDGARATERRETILAAALAEFSENGFAATRIDDVARRAGVAKGTIYLYFRDKDSLFQELVRSMLGAVAGNIGAATAQDVPTREIAERVAAYFLEEIYATPRQDVIRLIVSEGARFPKLAEFYHREVLAKILLLVRELMRRAAARGELKVKAAAEFPQLLGAPAIIGIIWNSLFGSYEPLDVPRMLSAQLDLLFGERGKS
jgi:AcrR family transcriptional regulator